MSRRDHPRSMMDRYAIPVVASSSTQRRRSGDARRVASLETVVEESLKKLAQLINQQRPLETLPADLGATTTTQAAAPQPPQVETSTTASTSSLVDVDTPSDVQTDTQADRIEREQQAAAEAEAKKKKARSAREKAAASARSADNWLVAKMESLGDGPATALFAGNLAVVMGLGAVMGYKAWGLYERRALGWKGITLGLGLLSIVGLGEGVFTSAYYRAKAKGKKQ
ncbi:hypothetical protein MAPG_01331 [Magnaporthiopsis poae ATCC 64411]|uniref:Mitochondrial outer membrane protein OM14 C-terminal domain-containing protein n=1 Tax=Magnaporthiopsis poae (strain ATCC 64411 / 73-15) TaxID=644358 RepID=A0A0C4DNF0_MAGP6|nr:hypothetical protein MAPG_01331 [Magnaporthiopsis poae ATCC 64411]